MLKKTIKYTAFDGQEYEEDFYFHLTKAEMIELETSKEGGMSEWIKTLSETRDGNIIIAEMKKLVLGAYGKKSPDGKRFVKTQELRDEFESSEAYSEFFFSLVTDAEAAAEFANGVIPANFEEDVAKLTRADLAVVPDAPEIPQTPPPPPPPPVRFVSRQEVQDMDQVEYSNFIKDVVDGTARMTE